MMAKFSWSAYLTIVALAVFGAVAILPYMYALNGQRMAQVPLSPAQLVLVSALQSTVMYAILAFLGLLAANAIGLRIGSAPRMIGLAVILGALGTVALLLIERLIFHPNLPAALAEASPQIALWRRFLATFYGGITEEVLMRLFVVSGAAWLLGRVWQTPAGLPTSGAFWVAILLAALLFGLGHLPATAAITPLTPLIVVRAIVLNGIIGVICGWLYWQHGFVAAIAAHYTADIVLHVISPFFLS